MSEISNEPPRGSARTGLLYPRRPEVAVSRGQRGNALIIPPREANFRGGLTQTEQREKM
jgi:hypothetical protein